ncbi:hypothetical protein BVX98_06340 [bacterium F11]|nr:hypothetical protein BVX98_06340 [bacterium F11]
MKTLTKFIFFLGLFALIPLQIQGECRENSDPKNKANGQNVLFIDKDNCNCQDPPLGSIEGREWALDPTSPWCSFSALDESNLQSIRVKAGDTVYIRGGDYEENPIHPPIIIKSSGDANNPITIRPYEEEEVIIRNGNYTQKFFFEIHGSHFILDSLEFVGTVQKSNKPLNARKLVALRSGEGHLIENCIFRDTHDWDDIGHGNRYPEEKEGEEGWGRTFYLESIRNTVIRNNLFRCNPDGIGLVRDQYKGEGLLVNISEDILIEDNKTQRCGHQGFSLRESERLIVQNNEITNEFHTGIGYWKCNDSIIRNNWFHDWNTTPTSGSLSGNGLQVQSSNNTKIYNNTFHTSSAYDAHAISIGVNIVNHPDDTANGNMIFNNTIYRGGSIGIFLGHFTGGQPATNRLANNYIFNNIIYGINWYDTPYEESHNKPITVDLFMPDQNNAYGNQWDNNVLVQTDGNPFVAGFNNDANKFEQLTLDELNARPYANGNRTVTLNFVNPDNKDFNLMPTDPFDQLQSSCHEDLTYDFYGATRPSQNCSIGAVEHSIVQFGPPQPESFLPAFPGAVGYGAKATGGRGGDVYVVTNLLDYDDDVPTPDGMDCPIPGSLRCGVDTINGPRTIVFNVAGYIKLERMLKIQTSNLTLAGQTAPGQGITIVGYPTIFSGRDFIVRYLRFRLGDYNAKTLGSKVGKGKMDLLGSSGDTIAFGLGSELIILDHLSTSWGMDETLDAYRAKNYTIQNCLIAEGLDYSYHEKGPHGFGLILRNNLSLEERSARINGVTLYRSLIAHNRARNPHFSVGSESSSDFYGMDAEVVNNVIYDWSHNSSHVGTNPSRGFLNANYIGNYLVVGPSKVDGIRNVAFFGHNGHGSILFHGRTNYMDIDGDLRHDGTLIGDEAFRAFEPGDLVSIPFPFTLNNSPYLMTAPEAYNWILNSVGASKHRDYHDTRIIAQLITRSGQVINSQDDLISILGIADPLVPLEPGTPVADSDLDGMPDSWELSHGLNPNDDTDRNNKTLNSEGYTNLEVYLNSLVENGSHSSEPPFINPNPGPVDKKIRFINYLYPLEDDKISIPCKDNLIIRDLNGFEVVTLKCQASSSEYGTAIWDGTTRDGFVVASGTYFFQDVEGNIEKISVIK